MIYYHYPLLYSCDNHFFDDDDDADDNDDVCMYVCMRGRVFNHQFLARLH